MSFQPVLPIGGYSGWRFLSRTLEAQKTAFEQSSEINRKTEYFEQEIGEIGAASDLVANRRLLEVSLNAFGLGEDINSKAFVERVLGDGTLAPEALSNRLADKRYFAFSKAFGFGEFGTSNTQLSSFSSDIVSRYLNNAFETAVGEQDPNLRLALSVESQLNDVLETTESTDAQWFTVMGNTALRTVFEGALGLPASFGSLDIDKQLETFKERSERVFGTSDLGTLNNEETRETLIRNFLVRSEINASNALASSNIALSLLQGG